MGWGFEGKRGIREKMLLTIYLKWHIEQLPNP